MLDHTLSTDADVSFATQQTDVQSTQTDMPQDAVFSASVVFENRLHLLAPDGIVQREFLPALKTAEHILDAAHANAQALRLQAHTEALAIREQAEVEGQMWLERKEKELQAGMAFQQSQWLAQLQPVWMQALERTLRSLCGGLLRPDVLAGAIEMAVREFHDRSELCIHVHPDDLDHARDAVARLVEMPALIRFHSDTSMQAGSCRLSNSSCEVSMQLDRAIALALGETCSIS